LEGFFGHEALVISFLCFLISLTIDSISYYLQICIQPFYTNGALLCTVYLLFLLLCWDNSIQFDKTASMLITTIILLVERFTTLSFFLFGSSNCLVPITFTNKPLLDGGDVPLGELL
jgi:hypothetical protein